MRGVIAILLLISSLVAAHAFGLGKEGKMFGRLGSLSNKKAAAVVPGCASPTAPNGVVDLSQCSNAFYVAVIF